MCDNCTKMSRTPHGTTKGSKWTHELIPSKNPETLRQPQLTCHHQQQHNNNSGIYFDLNTDMSKTKAEEENHCCCETNPHKLCTQTYIHMLENIGRLEDERVKCYVTCEREEESKGRGGCEKKTTDSTEFVAKTNE